MAAVGGGAGVYICFPGGGEGGGLDCAGGGGYCGRVLDL